MSVQESMKNLGLFRRFCLVLWFMATVVDGKNCDPRCEFRRLCQADIGNCFCAVA